MITTPAGHPSWRQTRILLALALTTVAVPAHALAPLAFRVLPMV
ncbi:hypothetical protein ACF1BP_33105 [Streptomyces sp. NPDC014735]